MARKPGLTGLQDAQQLSAFGLVRHPRKSLGQGGFRVQLSGGSVAHTQAQGVLTLGAPFLVGSSTTRTPYSAAILTIPGGAVNFSGASVTRTRTPSATFTPGTSTGGNTGSASYRYVNANIAGTGGNGMTWATAFKSFPTMQRGLTYYVASGNYASPDFTVPAQGTTLITIKKATATDHGEDISGGWNAATMGSGQAAFSGDWWITTGYWLVDGQTGWWLTGEPYGFKVTETNQNTPIIQFPGTTGGNTTIRHIQIVGRTDAGTGTGSGFNDAFRFLGQPNLTLSYFEITDCGRCPFIGVPMNTIVEHGWVKSYHGPEQDIHSEIASLSGVTPFPWVNNGNMTFRYNLFTKVVSTGGIMWDNQTNTASSCFVYGNVFHNDGSWGDTGNGVLGGWTGGGAAGNGGEKCFNFKAWNNTFIGVTSTSMPVWSGFPKNFGGCEARNNLYYNCASISYGVFGTHNNNHYASTSGSGSDTSSSTSTGNPFVNSAARDYRLVNATPAGATLAAPYNQDAYGNTRGADGVWDRGAFEKV